MTFRCFSLVALCAFVAACSDLPLASPLEKPASPERVIARLECAANTRAGTLSCAPASALPPGINADLILGGQNTYVKLASLGTGFDNPTTPTTWTAQVNVQNLTVQPMGTRDGVNEYTASPGIKVFFVQPPSNGVTIANADGTGTFTGSNQPYYLYTQGNGGLFSAYLQPGNTSATRTWQFNVNGQTTFTFSVLISTAMPDEPGVLRSTRITPSSNSGAFNDIWGTSASDVFAVGGGGEIYHYNGALWSAMSNPTTDELWRVGGTSATNVWAVGDAGRVVRYNGSSWSNVATLTGPTTHANLNQYALWVSGTQVWTGGDEGYVHLWNGVSFSQMSVGLPGTYTVVGLWGTSSSDVYAGGGGQATGQGWLRHWNGSSWSAVNMSTANPAGDDVNAIWGTSSANVWAGGYEGLIMHFDGTSWTRMTPVNGAPSPFSNFYDIDGTSASDVWFTSTDGTRVHWDGTQLYTFNGSGSNSMAGVYAAARQRAFFSGVDFSGPSPVKTIVDYTR